MNVTLRRVLTSSQNGGGLSNPQNEACQTVFFRSNKAPKTKVPSKMAGALQLVGDQPPPSCSFAPHFFRKMVIYCSFAPSLSAAQRKETTFWANYSFETLLAMVSLL